MTPADIKTAIFDGLSAIAPEADLDHLPANANVRQSLDIDSYDFLNFLIGLHERLGVEIPEADYGKLNTLDEMTGYLTARMT